MVLLLILLSLFFPSLFQPLNQLLGDHGCCRSGPPACCQGCISGSSGHLHQLPNQNGHPNHQVAGNKASKPLDAVNPAGKSRKKLLNLKGNGHYAEVLLHDGGHAKSTTSSSSAVRPMESIQSNQGSTGTNKTVMTTATVVRGSGHSAGHSEVKVVSCSGHNEDSGLILSGSMEDEEDSSVVRGRLLAVVDEGGNTSLEMKETQREKKFD